MKKYLVLADGKSPHTLKWVNILKQFFDVYIISFNGFSEDIEECIDIKHLYSLYVNVSKNGGNIRVLKHIFKVALLIREISPDYINAHYITSYGSIACISSLLSKFRGKVVLSAWGSDILRTPQKNLLYLILTKWLLHKASVVTSDSLYMTRRIKNIYNKTRVITFPFGVERMPSVLEEEKDELYFFSNRAIEKNYNINQVVELFSFLCQANANRKLIIANDGGEKEKVLTLVKRLSLERQVEFVGFLKADQQAHWYRKCKFYFSIPTSDSTSVSLLEAMAHGCIPIVSDIDSNREWIDDGKNGIVFSGDIQKLHEINLKDAFDINREIIKKTAIWKENVKKLVILLEKNEEQRSKE